MIVSMFCSAISFPAMLFERISPLKPPIEKLRWEHDRSWFHNQKNITTEYIRADAQWWSKFLTFIILVQLLALGVSWLTFL